MNNFVSNFRKDFLFIHKKFIKNNIIDNQIDFERISFEVSNDDQRGHLSTNAALIYQKFSKLNINEILKILTKELILLKNIEEIKSAGPGFINIFFKKKYFITELKKIIKIGSKYGHSKIGKNKKINIEFVSANPTGPLHIAHSRGAVFGDVLSNLLESVGYFVTREYYVNDAGQQIQTLGESLFIRYKQELGITNEKISIQHYPGNYLINIAKKIIINDSDKWVNYEKKKRKKYFENFATKEILKIIKKDLKNIGIYFDKYVSEKKIIKENNINFIFKLLKQKKLLYEGLLEKPKGQISTDWEPRKQTLFKSTLFGDDVDRPFVKSNNEWTYFANDSAYHLYKINRGFDKLINVWGSDHIGYIKRMQSIVNAMSNDKVKLNIKICQLVHLKKNNKQIKMSKRSGNFITIGEVVNEVGSDVVRFFMLYRKNDAQMDFDLSKVVEKSKDNPIFYVQYAYARSASIIRLSNKIINKKKYVEVLKDINFEKYLSPYEWKIIIKILSWPSVLENSALSEEPHKIIYYLESLSSLFHTFWNKGKDNESLRFIDSKDIKKTVAKVYLIKSMQIIYKSAFKILNIKPLEKM